MTLRSGQNLLHYRIVDKIGEGGMGEVWRAVDTMLDREVALKVLPDAVAGDAERLARFEREAKLLASLSHANIAAVHGLHETGDGRYFLAMELVPGEDLVEVLARGPIAIDEALAIARQTALALEAAHANGVVHRDLKPANIRLTPGRQVKVLDFGLAKALESAGASGDSSRASMSPTMTSVGSRAGVILGTAAYMSPEQARGHAVDRRADVWAFGCVLYEMLTGRAAFAGPTVSDTLASILKELPDWSLLPAETPRAVRRLLQRCLRKDPQARLHDVADARIELEDAATEAPDMPTEPAARSRRGLLPWTVAGLVTLVALWLAVDRLTRPRQPEPGETGRFAIDLPPDLFVEIRDSPSLDISEDGRWIVYVGLDENWEGRLVLRNVDSFTVEPIAGTDGAKGPFFSPDGEWIGFFDYAAGKLKKIPRSGGAAIALCDAPEASRGGDWGIDGTIVFTRGLAGGLYTVPASGGAATPLVVPEWSEGEKSYRHPQILPDGKSVVATKSSSTIRTYDDAEIVAVPLDTGEARVVLQGGSSPRYAESGHILYGRAGSLWAVPFDADALEVTGTPFEIVDDVVTSDIFGSAQFAVSAGGVLVYAPGGPEMYYSELVWFELGTGVLDKLAVEPAVFGNVVFSPDGSRLALCVLGGNDVIAIHDLRRGTTRRLTAGGWDNNRPVWSPDGLHIAFDVNRSGTSDIYWQRADGSSPPELLVAADVDLDSRSFSPDGNWFAYTTWPSASQGDIWLLPMDAGGPAGDPRPFTRTEQSETAPAISPDGKWIAYSSDETDHWQVYVQPFPDGGAKWQVSTTEGWNPLWSPDASRIYYGSSAGLMAVDVGAAASFDAGTPRVVHAAADLDVNLYAIAPDGKRFVAAKPLHDDEVRRLHVVLGLLEELRGR